MTNESVPSEFTMTQKSPMIFSMSVPSGTVPAFVRLLTWMVRTVLPSTLKQTMSIHDGYYAPSA